MGNYPDKLQNVLEWWNHTWIPFRTQPDRNGKSDTGLAHETNKSALQRLTSLLRIVSFIKEEAHIEFRGNLDAAARSLDQQLMHKT